MERGLDKFITELWKIFQIFFSLIPKKSKFRKKNLNKRKLLFKQDLIAQFIKAIFKTGKYSSGIYGNLEGFFFRKSEIQIFFWNNFFKIKKYL